MPDDYEERLRMLGFVVSLSDGAHEPPEAAPVEVPPEPEPNPNLEKPLAVFLADRTADHDRPAYWFALSPGLPDRYNRESHEYLLLMRDLAANEDGYLWRWYPTDEFGVCKPRLRTSIDSTRKLSAAGVLLEAGFHVVEAPEERQAALQTIAARKEAARKL